MAYEVFISYSHQDQALRTELEKHLSNLKRQNIITSWYDGDIIPGAELEPVIMNHLKRAQIILLLVSADFIASDFCYTKEMKEAFARHDANQARVIPILLRPTDWKGAPFEKLKILPTDAKPITRWPTHDEGFVDVIQGIRNAIDEMTNKSKHDQKHIWNIPYARNPLFTGREDVLKKLSEVFKAGKTASLVRPQALSGLGGIGKTQTAVEYVYLNKDDYQVILWVKADTQDSINAEFVTMASLLDLPEKMEQDQYKIVEAVKRWFQEHTDWLLIFDNADDLAMVQDYLPQGNQGHILLTTRAQAMAGLARKIELETMESEDGAILLLRRAGLLELGSNFEIVSTADRTLAQEIVKAMGGLPLALDQAGAYLEETGESLSNYLSIYHQQRSALLNRRGGFRPQHPESVAATWSLSFEKVEQANTAAAELLRFCAFLAPDVIPEELFTKSEADFGPTLEQVVSDPSRLNAAIRELLKYSLVHRDSETKTLNIHPLIQAALIDQMSNETKGMLASRVVRAVNVAFPEVGSSEWENDHSQRYLPPAQVCASLIKQYNLFSFEAMDLLDRTGLYLLNKAQYAQADSFLEQAINMREYLQDPERIEVFVSYSNQDQKLLQELSSSYLYLLKKQGVISTWHTYNINTLTNSSNVLKKYLNISQITLLLISSDFLASDYCYSEDLRRAIIGHERGEMRVIPIILRPAVWNDAPFGKLQVLPRDAKPVITWPSSNEAWASIIESLELVCTDILNKSLHTETIQMGKLEHYNLFQVFLKSGVPDVTFVARDDFDRLQLSLAQPGRGVVIEGPSGVGKTTAVRKTIDELITNVETQRWTSGTGTSVKMLSARKPEDQIELQTLPNWHEGTVIIDDFHRLEPTLYTNLVDYLKYLADTEPLSKKLVIVGIPQTGQALVNTSFDIATRIDVFKLSRVKDGLILSMIEKGENALNIEFDHKTEIVLAANGSLNIAQFLCFNICHREKIVETQDKLRMVPCDIEAAVSSVMVDLARKFDESIKRFAAMGGYRDTTCLRLLEELANSEDGFLPLSMLKHIKSDLAPGIARFISDRWMDKLYKEYPTCGNHFFFDQAVQALVVDDPQLTFYLKKLKFSSLARDVGKTITSTQRKVFISYSHKDAKWLERLQVHLKPLERKGIIDPWADTKIAVGAKWREEIQVAIESATVAVVLVSADFLASDFISEYELPQILSQSEDGGTTIIPIIVAPCMFETSGLNAFQSINSPDQPLDAMTHTEQEKSLVELAKKIQKRWEA